MARKKKAEAITEEISEVITEKVAELVKAEKEHVSMVNANGEKLIHLD